VWIDRNGAQGGSLAILPYQRFIRAFDKTTSLDDIRVVYYQVCEHYRFDYFSHVAQLPHSFVEPKHIHINGNPQAWQRRYNRNNYMERDPLVQHCAMNITPIDWTNVRDLESRNYAVSRIMREARSYGLKNGVSIPVHSGKGDSAVVSFSVNSENRASSRNISEATPDLYLLSAYAHQAVMRVMEETAGALPKVKLSSRERECLMWAAEGETALEICHRIGIAESTVIFHLQNAMKKLGACNRQQAVAKAAWQGLLRPGFG